MRDTEDSGLLILRGARLVLPEQVVLGRALLVEGGRIKAVIDEGEAPAARDARAIDLDGTTLLPGFIDIHIHGALGVDVNDRHADGLRRVRASSPRAASPPGFPRSSPPPKRTTPAPPARSNS